MQDPITLIEEIQRNQAKINADLEQLKAKESQYIIDIQAIQTHQQEVAAEIDELQIKINSRKNGGTANGGAADAS